MVSRLMLILELLSDGKWHEIDELLVRMKLTEQKFREVTEFLDKYGFVEFDHKNQKVKINQDFRKLLLQKTVAY
jgi:DNA-binding IclR family transcriptional regulator